MEAIAKGEFIKNKLPTVDMNQYVREQMAKTAPREFMQGLPSAAGRRNTGSEASQSSTNTWDQQCSECPFSSPRAFWSWNQAEADS